MHHEKMKNNNKCVFFLGAGFSADANIPVQKDLLKKYLQYHDDFPKRRELIDSFLEEVFSFKYQSLINNRHNIHYPNLEDIFSLLDNAIINNEFIMDIPPDKLIEIRKSFTPGIIKIIDQSSSNAEYIRNFAQFLTDSRLNSDISDPFSIITTNWDIVLLNRFREYHDKIIEKYSGKKPLSEISQSKDIDRKKIALIDYCIYTHALRDYKNHIPSFKIKCMGYKNIKLLNLHGSPIWLICQKCKKIFSPPTYDKDKRYEKDALPVIENKPGRCPACKESTENFEKSPKTFEYSPKAYKEWNGKKGRSKDSTLYPILIMPTYFKIIQNVHLLDIWQNAAMELQEAKYVVFIGYSLPEADYLIRKLLLTNIQKDAEIYFSLHRRNHDSLKITQTELNYRKLFGNRISDENIIIGNSTDILSNIQQRILDGKINCFQDL